MTSTDEPVEISWFSALCDDDYEFLGVPDPSLASSWQHCADIVQTADRNGFDNVLHLGTAFALLTVSAATDGRPRRPSRA